LTRIDMTTREWHELVKPVLPHAATDPDLPELSAVRIEVGDRAVYAGATDRYTLAVERHPQDDLTSIRPVHLNARDAKLSLSLFRYDKDINPALRITIDTAPWPVSVAGTPGSVDRLAVTLESEDGTRLVLHDERDPSRDPLAGWRKRISKLICRDHEGYSSPALTLSAGYLARWAAAVRKGERLSVFTGRDGDMPILITVESHFVGAWQPISYLTTPAEALTDSPWHKDLRTWELSFDTETGEKLEDDE
jgi:hypothetical protein